MTETPIADALYRMLMERGPIADINFGDVPVHYNPAGANKSIHWETGVLLCNFLEAYRPNQVVELGTFRGYSTAWLILGTLLAGHGRVDAFEVFPEGHYGSMWYDEYQLPKTNFKYHEIPGGIWKYPAAIPETIDLLYHDTEHLPGPTIEEMGLLLPRIQVGGVVLIDDMLHPDYQPMQTVIRQMFIGHPDWTFNTLRLGHGLGIAKRLK
jgi:predicted O-methyltransferase YrrM